MVNNYITITIYHFIAIVQTMTSVLVSHLYPYNVLLSVNLMTNAQNCEISITLTEIVVVT